MNSHKKDGFPSSSHSHLIQTEHNRWFAAARSGREKSEALALSPGNDQDKKGGLKIQAEELNHVMRMMMLGGENGRSRMGKFYKRIGVVAVLFIGLIILLAALATSGSGIETKTAYTRDNIHYISKERVDENIRYEYAKPGDYREVQVPLDTIVVGASTIPINVSMPEGKRETATEENSPPESDQTASTSANKYPYASLSIGLLVVGGLVFFIASVFSGRDRQ